MELLSRTEVYRAAFPEAVGSSWAPTAASLWLQLERCKFFLSPEFPGKGPHHKGFPGAQELKNPRVRTQTWGGKTGNSLLDKTEAAKRAKVFKFGWWRPHFFQSVCATVARREMNMAAAGRGVSLGMYSIWHCSLDRWKGTYLDYKRRNSFDNHTGTHYFTILNLCRI